MKFFRCTVATVALVVGLQGMLWAQDDPIIQIPSGNTTYGGSSAEFLTLGSGARGMSLGGAFATIVDDVNALHYNPANLPSMQGTEFSLSLMPYFADTDYYWAGLAFPFSDGDFGVGFFLGHFGFGNSPIYTEADPDGLSQETFGVSEVVGGVSIAHAFIDRFSAGLTIKFISDDLATGAAGGAKASTAAIDFGVNFHSELGNRPIALSFVVQNLGGSLAHSGEALRFRDVNGSEGNVTIPDQRQDPPVANLGADAFPLPTSFRAGLAYDVVSAEATRLSLMGEFVESNYQKVQFGMAGEFAWTPVDTPVGVALRGSYTTQPDNDSSLGAVSVDSGTDGLGLGGGLFYRLANRYRLQFDYAYRHYGALGSVDVFSATFALD
jgi:hypothetical protein